MQRTPRGRLTNLGKVNMTNLTVFQFHNQDIRVVLRDGQPWFVAKDLCDVLQINNCRQAVSRLDATEKTITKLCDRDAGNPRMTIVSESGMYAVTLSSRKPETKLFRQWIVDQLTTLRQSSALFSYMAANPHVTDNTGFVYLAMSGKGWYKIGMSKQPHKRMSSLQVGSPLEIKLIHRIFTFDCVALEKALHSYYQAYWLRGEWFELSNAMVADFPSVVDNLDATLEQGCLESCSI